MYSAPILSEVVVVRYIMDRAYRGKKEDIITGRYSSVAYACKRVCLGWGKENVGMHLLGPGDSHSLSLWSAMPAIC